MYFGDLEREYTMLHCYAVKTKLCGYSKIKVITFLIYYLHIISIGI